MSVSQQALYDFLSHTYIAMISCINLLTVHTKYRYLHPIPKVFEVVE
jgi:hypothetical protein